MAVAIAVGGGLLYAAVGWFALWSTDRAFKGEQ